MNKYPDGKLNDDDEGSLKIALLIEDNRVIIDFGKKVSWLGFDKHSLRSFIDGLEDKFDKIK